MGTRSKAARAIASPSRMKKKRRKESQQEGHDSIEDAQSSWLTGLAPISLARFTNHGPRSGNLQAIPALFLISSRIWATAGICTKSLKEVTMRGVQTGRDPATTSITWLVTTPMRRPPGG